VPETRSDAMTALCLHHPSTKVEALVSESGATFWIEHDAALFNILKQGPDFYR